MTQLATSIASAGAAALADLLGAPVEVDAVEQLTALPAGGAAGTRTALGGTGYQVAVTADLPGGVTKEDATTAFASAAAAPVADALGVPPATAVAQPAPTVTAGPDAKPYRAILTVAGTPVDVLMVLDPSLAGPANAGPSISGPAIAEYPELGNGSGPAAPRQLSVLADVAMSVTVELGRARMKVRDLLALNTGSVVELDRAAGAAVDVLVNGTVVARGDVVVIDDELGVRITEVVDRA